MKRRYYDLKFSNQTRGQIAMPIQGPFIKASQFEQEIYSDMDWSDALDIATKQGKVTDVLDIGIGEVAFQRSEEGGVEFAVFIFDTSG